MMQESRRQNAIRCACFIAFSFVQATLFVESVSTLLSASSINEALNKRVGDVTEPLNFIRSRSPQLLPQLAKGYIETAPAVIKQRIDTMQNVVNGDANVFKTVQSQLGRNINAGIGIGELTKPSEEQSTSAPPPMYAWSDLITGDLILVNAKTSDKIIVNLYSLPGWKKTGPVIHTYLLNATMIYLGYQAFSNTAAGVMAIRISDLDWAKKKGTFVIVADLDVDPLPGYVAPAVDTTEGKPAIAQFDLVSGVTISPHEFTRAGSSKYLFLSILSDERILMIDTDAMTLTVVRDPRFTTTSHGVFFNSRGDLGLVCGSFWEQGVTLVKFNQATGQFSDPVDIPLGPDGGANGYGARTRNVLWLDNRYALVGTIQREATNLTPPGRTIIKPGVFLVDAKDLAVKQIIFWNADDQSSSAVRGIRLAAAYLALTRQANGLLLWVAEEDVFYRGAAPLEGSVAVFNMTDDFTAPSFVKRFNSGPKGGLMGGFGGGHMCHVLAMCDPATSSTTATAVNDCNTTKLGSGLADPLNAIPNRLKKALALKGQPCKERGDAKGNGSPLVPRFKGCEAVVCEDGLMQHIIELDALTLELVGYNGLENTPSMLAPHSISTYPADRSKLGSLFKDGQVPGLKWDPATWP